VNSWDGWQKRGWLAKTGLAGKHNKKRGEGIKIKYGVVGDFG